MKNKFSYFVVLSVFFAKVAFAQVKTNELVGSKWRVKNIVIRITNGNIEDSLNRSKFYKKFDSVEVNFYSKKNVVVSWGKYKISGKYRVDKTNDFKSIVFTKWKNFGFYENGSLERSEFAVFLYPFKSRVIPFLNDSSFMMLAKYRGTDCEIFYKKVE
jgi:hypothetical protein